MAKEDVGFWLAVGLVAIAAVALFKLLGAYAGGAVPALGDLAAFI